MKNQNSEVSGQKLEKRQEIIGIGIAKFEKKLLVIESIIEKHAELAGIYRSILSELYAEQEVLDGEDC